MTKDTFYSSNLLLTHRPQNKLTLHTKGKQDIFSKLLWSPASNQELFGAPVNLRSALLNVAPFLDYTFITPVPLGRFSVNPGY